jgi:hypothetical protein
MSKIFEALKQAELARADDQNATALVTSVATRAVERPERRRTARLNVQVPLFVYGYTPEGDPFYEDAHTIAINTHGALIFMPIIVRPGQRLLVTKEGDEQAKECIVLSVRARLMQGADVALEFPTPIPDFRGNWESPEPAS